MADFTAGLLAAIAVLAGLLGRGHDGAPGLEVSLLGAALAVQTQASSRSRRSTARRASSAPAGPAVAHRRSRAAGPGAPRGRQPRALLPRVRRRRWLLRARLPARAPARGRRRPAGARRPVGRPTPRRLPASADERAQRDWRWWRSSSAGSPPAPAATWVQRLSRRRRPAAEVRMLDQLFEHDQVAGQRARPHRSSTTGVGAVKLLGSLFKIDGAVAPPQRRDPGLGRAHRGGAGRVPPAVTADDRCPTHASRVRRERGRRGSDRGRPGASRPGRREHWRQGERRRSPPRWDELGWDSGPRAGADRLRRPRRSRARPGLAPLVCSTGCSARSARGILIRCRVDCDRVVRDRRRRECATVWPEPSRALPRPTGSTCTGARARGPATVPAAVGGRATPPGWPPAWAISPAWARPRSS